MAPTMQVACSPSIAPDSTSRSPQERYTHVARSPVRVCHTGRLFAACPRRGDEAKALTRPVPRRDHARDRARSIERGNADDQLANEAFKEARSYFAADLGERPNQYELAPALGAVRLILVFVAAVVHGSADIAE